MMSARGRKKNIYIKVRKRIILRRKEGRKKS